jgi:hypothetical protein
VGGPFGATSSSSHQTTTTQASGSEWYAAAWSIGRLHAGAHRVSLGFTDIGARRIETDEVGPEGRLEGTAIQGYVVEDHADPVLHSTTTQQEAIA